MARRLDKTELEQYAQKAGFSLERGGQLEELLIVCEGLFDTLDTLERIEHPPTPNVLALRDMGRRATPEEDPLNAVVRWCSVKADRDGRLAGKRVGLKDMIS